MGLVAAGGQVPGRIQVEKVVRTIQGANRVVIVEPDRRGSAKF